MGTRKIATALVAAVLAAGTLSAASAQQPPAPFTQIPTAYVGEVTVGAPLFWDGHHVRQGIGTGTASTGPEQEIAECELSGECRAYQFHVGEGGSSLRVALDLILDDRVHHGVEATNKHVRFRVYDSAGRFTGVGCQEDCGPLANTHPYTGEVTISEPAAGMWSVLVIPAAAQDWTYRMRAALEREPVPPADPSAPELPNMRIVPPFEFTFTAPATHYGPDGGTDEVRPLSCTPPDAPDDPGISLTTCLRFSTGPENFGDGSLDLRGYPGPGDLVTPAYQVTYRADGSVLDPGSPAGEFAWHATHSHWHFQGFLTYELLAVQRRGNGRKVDLVDVGVPSRKVGACPADERMADWGRVFQSPEGYAAGVQGDSGYTGLCLFPHAPSATISPGWGDLYEWQRWEQFVEFPVGGDGLPVDGVYVLRGSTDSDDVLLESDESDNTSYALIRVDGKRVTLLERGYGSDPWNDGKRVEWASSACDPILAKKCKS